MGEAPAHITAEMSIPERLRLYSAGGCLFVTTRILVRPFACVSCAVILVCMLRENLGTCDSSASPDALYGKRFSPSFSATLTASRKLRYHVCRWLIFSRSACRLQLWEVRRRLPAEALPASCPSPLLSPQPNHPQSAQPPLHPPEGVHFSALALLHRCISVRRETSPPPALVVSRRRHPQRPPRPGLQRRVLRRAPPPRRRQLHGVRPRAQRPPWGARARLRQRGSRAQGTIALSLSSSCSFPPARLTPAPRPPRPCAHVPLSPRITSHVRTAERAPPLQN